MVEPFIAEQFAPFNEWILHTTLGNIIGCFMGGIGVYIVYTETKSTNHFNPDLSPLERAAQGGYPNFLTNLATQCQTD